MTAIPNKALWQTYIVSPPALQAERFSRPYPWMDESGLDALLVLGNGARGRKGNLRYVSNYAAVSRYGAALVPRNGDPALFVPYPVHIPWAQEMSWISDVRLTTNLAGDVAQIFQDRGASRVRLGLIGQEFVPNLETDLTRASADLELVSVESSFARLRMVKTPLEIELARHCARIADTAFAGVGALVGSGATESEIFAATEASLRRSNSEECLILLDSRGDQIRPFPLPRKLEPGDLFQCSIEPVSPGGHWIQSVRMFSRGAADDKARSVIEGSIEALNLVQRALKPGVTLGQVAGLMAERLEKLAPQGRAPYGHGAGMDLFEPPVIQSGSDVRVKENMILVIHPNLLVNGRNFYVGDTYLVTTHGAERLSKFPLGLAAC